MSRIIEHGEPPAVTADERVVDISPDEDRDGVFNPVDVNDEVNAVNVTASVTVLEVTAGEVAVVSAIVEVDGSAVAVF